MRPLDSISMAERQLVAWYVAQAVGVTQRIDTSAFSDSAAHAILAAVERLEAKGEPVSIPTVQTELPKAKSLPTELGELVALLFDPVATEQPFSVVQMLEKEVMEARQRRVLRQNLERSLRQLVEGGSPIEILSDLQSHHLPSFGSFGSFDSEPFPTGMLPPLCRMMVREIARVAMVPESLAAGAVIGTISAAIGGGLRIKNYRGDTGANLFLLPVAASGTGKDSALNIAMKPLLQIEEDRLELWRKEVQPDLKARHRQIRSKLAEVEKRKPEDCEAEANCREELSLLEREKAEIERSLDAEPDLIVGDCTKEALGVAMAARTNEVIAGISSEARGILATLQGRYSNASDEDFFAGGFSGTPLKVKRIGRATVRLKSPCLTLLWMVQPDAFRKMAGNPEMIESGFLPRFLIFDTKAEPMDVPEECPEINAGIAQEWEEMIYSLVATFYDAETPQLVTATPEASEILRSFDNDIRKRRRTGGDLADVAAFAARWPEIAWRLALCLHTAHFQADAAREPLTDHSTKFVLAVMDWFTNEALLLLEGVREDRRRDRQHRLRELLEGTEGKRMTLRDLQKSHGFDPQEVEAMGRRERWLEIRQVQNPKGGPRSSVAFFKSE